MPAEIEKEELLEAIRKDGPRKVVQQYRHNLLPSRTLVELYGEHPEREVLLFLALYPTVPSQVLEDLTEAYPDPEILAAAALNPRCGHLLLVRMAREGGAPVRAALAANKQQNNKITAALVNDPNLFVRAALAGNASIAPSYRYALALDPEPSVRAALATAGKLPDELAHTLAADSSVVVRANTYGFAKVEEPLLLGWANSDNAEAQRLILTRKNLSEDVVRSLCQSPDSVVQKEAFSQYTPTESEWLARAESENQEQRLDAAGYAELPVAIQHLLANDPSAEVRVALASNPTIDDEVARWFAASNDAESCLALAENPALSDAVKIELCHHELEDVRMRMAYRDDLTHEQLEILVNEREGLNLIGHLALRGVRFSGTKPELIDRLLALRRPSLHAFAAASEELTNVHVHKLMRSESAQVRLALCENPVLTAVALEKLTEDWNPSVAAAAARRLTEIDNEAVAEPSQSEPEAEPSLVSRIVNLFK
ncbi:MAG: hypothetical protein JXR40_01875 [Pontiellaceae bacterium]|nr:hypothetical protein [Pontiellaceae bacterium]